LNRYAIPTVLEETASILSTDRRDRPTNGLEQCLSQSAVLCMGRYASDS
jgi:hypothetical protein